MQQKIRFYDRYHQKNHRFTKVIGRSNFTYFYILKWLHSGYILTKKPNFSILDVGCGVGTISLYLASLGYRVKGLDVSARAIALAQAAQKDIGLSHVQFVRGELDHKKEKYDLVTCFEVIEHIENDLQFARDLAAKLRPGGHLLLSTPSRLNFLYRIGFYQKFDAEVGHLRRYTPTEISQLLQKAGLHVQKIASTESILRNLLFTTKLGVVIKLMKGPLIPLFHAVDEALTPIFGASDIIVLAHKP